MAAGLLLSGNRNDDLGLFARSDQTQLLVRNNHRLVVIVRRLIVVILPYDHRFQLLGNGDAARLQQRVRIPDGIGLGNRDFDSLTGTHDIAVGQCESRGKIAFVIGQTFAARPVDNLVAQHTDAVAVHFDPADGAFSRDQFVIGRDIPCETLAERRHDDRRLTVALRHLGRRQHDRRKGVVGRSPFQQQVARLAGIGQRTVAQREIGRAIYVLYHEADAVQIRFGDTGTLDNLQAQLGQHMREFERDSRLCGGISLRSPTPQQVDARQIVLLRKIDRIEISVDPVFIIAFSTLFPRIIGDEIERPLGRHCDLTVGFFRSQYSVGRNGIGDIVAPLDDILGSERFTVSDHIDADIVNRTPIRIEAILDGFDGCSEGRLDRHGLRHRSLVGRIVVLAGSRPDQQYAQRQSHQCPTIE